VLLRCTSPPSLRLRSGQALTFPHQGGRDIWSYWSTP